MPKIQKVQRQKLNEIVLERLMDWIMDGTLSMGEKLNTERIAQMLGVSRMPVREAIGMLEQLGLAEAIPYVGYQIIDLDEKNVHEIYLLRQALEPEVAFYACQNIDKNGIEKVKCTQRQLEDELGNEGVSPKLLHSLNRDFHFGIYQYSNLDRFCNIINTLWSGLSFFKLIYAKKYITNKTAADDMIGVHREIITCLCNKDAEKIKDILVNDLKKHTVDVPATVSSIMHSSHDQN